MDVYPQFEEAVRSLYGEDKDWASVLPGIIDAYAEDDVRNTDYPRSFDASSGEVDLAHIHPLLRTRAMEVGQLARRAPSRSRNSKPCSATPSARSLNQWSLPLSDEPPRPRSMCAPFNRTNTPILVRTKSGQVGRFACRNDKTPGRSTDLPGVSLWSRPASIR